MIIEFLEKTSDIVGIIGVVLLLLVYFLLSMNKISSKQIGYQLFNLIGAAFILYSLLFHFNLASILLEISWITISLVGIYKILEAKKKQKDRQDKSLNNIYDLNNKKRNNK